MCHLFVKISDACRTAISRFGMPMHNGEIISSTELSEVRALDSLKVL